MNGSRPLRGTKSKAVRPLPIRSGGRGAARARRVNAGGRRRSGRGMVLVVVLVVVSLLTLAALTFSQLMLAERQATELAGRRLQARALAQSGIDYVRLMLAQDETSLMERGGLYNNPYELSGNLVVDDTDGRRRGRFAVISPGLQNGYYSGVRYGLEDESTKLNLNVVVQFDAEQAGTGREILMKLPGMTEDIADAILDWIDADDETRDYGAESDYYSAQVPGYAPKNGPLDSIDELLLVRDVTPWLLYGVDANRNGNTDSTEPDSQSLVDVDNTDGSLNSGWASYLTVHSMESNTSEEGESKIDLNQDDLETLYDELAEALSAEWATFIVAYRQNGPSTSTNTQQQQQASGIQKASINFEGQASQEIGSVLDLVGVGTQITLQNQQGGGGGGGGGGAGGSGGGSGGGGSSTSGGSSSGTQLAPLLEENSAELESELIKLLDTVTVSSEETISGRININQASRTVLLTIPGMTEETADRILANRIEDPLDADEGQVYTIWPLIEGVVDLKTMKSLERYICTAGSVYRAQIVGYFDGGGPYARLEVLFDATQSPPTVLSWNDMGHLGQGYPIEMLGLDNSQSTTTQ